MFVYVTLHDERRLVTTNFRLTGAIIVETLPYAKNANGSITLDFYLIVRIKYRSRDTGTS